MCERERTAQPSLSLAQLTHREDATQGAPLAFPPCVQHVVPTGVCRLRASCKESVAHLFCTVPMQKSRIQTHMRMHGYPCPRSPRVMVHAPSYHRAGAGGGAH